MAAAAALAAAGCGRNTGRALGARSSSAAAPCEKHIASKVRPLLSTCQCWQHRIELPPCVVPSAVPYSIISMERAAQGVDVVG